MNCSWVSVKPYSGPLLNAQPSLCLGHSQPNGPEVNIAAMPGLQPPEELHTPEQQVVQFPEQCDRSPGETAKFSR